MKKYKSVISLSKNERGIWDLDTIKGCNSGLNENKNGCYNDCYAYKTAKRYGIDFSKSIERHFENELHRKNIVNQIERIDMPFIRIGCSGDPSENWEHTLNIIEQIKENSQLTLFDISSKKQIVIITRHWKILTDEQLDNDYLINKSIEQYNRLKPYCKSVLRIVSCDFNEDNLIGKQKSEIQKKLFKNDLTIDTVFRPSKNNKFVLDKIINVKKMKFMNSLQLISKMNKKSFIGKCENCLEMCGINK